MSKYYQISVDAENYSQAFSEKHGLRIPKPLRFEVNTSILDCDDAGKLCENKIPIESGLRYYQAKMLFRAAMMNIIATGQYKVFSNTKDKVVFERKELFTA